MANTERIVVQVVVQGQKDLANLEKRTGSTTKSFGRMAGQIAAAAAAFSTINAAVGSAIKSFRDFEFQMAKVKAVTGASEKDFAMLSETAKELGRSTFFTAQQVAELQTNFGKLGFSTKEILDAQEATLLLATATDTDLGRAAVVAGASIRGFALDASEAGRVVDVMAKAFTSSALDIEKFQTSMTKVAPIAAGANISLEATTAVMGTLTDAGIEASIAGTSLRNIFLKMQDPTSDLSRHLGFTVNSSEDLQKALTQLNEEGLDNAEIMSLVDLRQVAAFQTMIDGAGRISDLTIELDNATGASADMAATVGDTLEGAFKRLTSASEGLSIEIMEKLGPGLKDLIDDFAKFLNKMAENSEGISKMIKGLIQVIKWLGIYKAGVIATRIATTALSTATFTATAALKSFRIALAKTGIGLVVVALGELAAKFLLVKDATGDAADETERYADAQERLKDRTEKFNNLISQRLGTTLKQSQKNVNLLNDEIRIRQTLLDQEEKRRKQVVGLKLMTDENIELTKKEIERLKEKIKLEKSNQEVIKKSIQDQTIANKSLIVAQEKLLAQAQKLPETTEAQLAAKNKQIESIELEIKRLKELGLTRDKDGNNVQASIERNIALADAQQKYMQGIRDNDFETADFAKHKMLLLEEEFNQEARRIQREFLEAKANDESLKENERVAAKQALMQFELDEETRLMDNRIAQMEREKEAEFALQDAKADALKGYLNIAAGFAEEGSALAKAIFLLQQGIAVKDVIVDNMRTNAQILMEGAALAIPSLGASIATAKALVTANNITAGVSIAAILAQTLQGLGAGKKARGGMIEEYANGGMVHGRSHAQGGEKFAVGGRVVELEGGEAVINKRSTAIFRNQLSAMNVAGGGVKFADGGLLNQPAFSQQQFNAINQSQMMGAMSAGGGVVVVEADITDSQNTVNVIEAQATV
jgi:TP901 family phage tail tape measure protein